MIATNEKRIEREWKYLIRTRDAFNRIINSEVRYVNGELKFISDHPKSPSPFPKKIGIIQWYLEDDDCNEHRIRLEIHKQKTGFVTRWLETKKVRTSVVSERTEEERTIEGEEIESVIDKIKSKKMVAKVRYVLFDDPEVIVDEFLFPSLDGFVMEIEQKSTDRPVDFDNIIDPGIIKMSEEEMIQKSNKRLAKITERSVNEIIGFVKNRMKDNTAVVLPLGLSINNTIKDEDKDRTKEEKEIKAEVKKLTEALTDQFIRLINSNPLDPEDKVEFTKGSRLPAELETLGILARKGYNLKNIILLTNAPYFSEEPPKNNISYEIYSELLEETKNKGVKVYCIFDEKREPCEIDETHFHKINKQVLYNTYILVKSVSEKFHPNIYIVDTGYNNKVSKTSLNLYRNIVRIMNYFTSALKDSEFVIDVTPGPKITGLILTLWGAFNDNDIYYKHEDQKELELIRIPRISVEWDMNFVDSIASTLEQLINKKDKATTDDYSLSMVKVLSLPEEVANLYNFESDKKAVLFYDIASMSQEYKEKRKMPFGYGEKLLKVFDNQKLADYIEDGIIEKWSYMWIGDQIPETVEHSQRHSKRIMEFTLNLLNKMGEDFFLKVFRNNELYAPYIQNTVSGIITYRDLLYFILLTAMNVHDLGHTYPKFTVPGTNVALYVDSLPSVVRDVHNELTVQLIDDMEYDILAYEKPFKEGSPTLKQLFGNKAEEVKKSIQIVSKYHRGYLPTKKNQKADRKKFVEALKLDILDLESAISTEESKYYIADELLRKIITFTTQWLRFIDGIDVQADRIITEAYHKNRVLRTKEECLYLYQKLQMTLSLETFGDRWKEIKTQIDDIVAELGKLQPENLDNSDCDLESIENNAETIENILYEQLKEITDKSQSSEHEHRIPHHLELADKIAFKAKQFRHFDKHKSVSNVYAKDFIYSNSDNSATLHIEIVPNTMANKSIDNLRKILNDIVKEIKSEFEKARIANTYSQVLKSFDIQVHLPDVLS